MTMKREQWSVIWRRASLLSLLAVGLGPTGCLCYQACLRLADEDDGDTVTVAVSQCIEVRLSANHTTGYEWVLAALDETVLARTDWRYDVDPHLPGVVGVGGTEVWSFEGHSPGTTQLRLEYRQPWMPVDTEPAELFELTVTVVESGS